MSYFLQVKGLEKKFGNQIILSKVSFSVKKGEIVAILGPSGCGKTTLLRCLAGLEPVTSGDVVLNNKSVTNNTAEERPVVLMFQSPLLFPHMTVIENVMFGLKQRKIPRKQRLDLALKMLEKTEMVPYKDSFPQSLSGGQQQRVALARALVMKPALLLLDEPFSSLDQHLKETLRNWVCSLLKEEGVTTLLVTHDKEEAMMIGNQVILLKNGKIQQQGRPSEVYQYPENENVEEMFSDGLQLNSSFIPSQYLQIIPMNQEIPSNIIGRGKVSSFFFRYGLCFYQVILDDHDRKIILHSELEITVGNEVWIAHKKM
ncbi:ABC transporter ATP-binding protein [Bacillaceae bacterium S4-13-58]